jgi:hypothetical protein
VGSPEHGLLSRRHFLALGTAITFPGGCVPSLATLREVDLDAIAPDRALLLGRIQVTILGDDRTGDTFILTNASKDEALLRPDGEVAWVVPRRREGDCEASARSEDSRH